MRIRILLISFFSIVLAGATSVLYPAGTQSNVAIFESLPHEEFM
jgi:hypothetical protein